MSNHRPMQKPPPSRRNNLPLWAACVSSAIAVLCLIGWTFGIRGLTSVLPGLPTMVPMTAGLTLLAGLALAVGQPGPSRRYQRWMALALLCAAGLLLLYYGFGRPHPVTTNGASLTGWRLPSPLTAMLFFGIGLGQLGLTSAHYVQQAQSVSFFPWRPANTRK